MAVRHAEGRTVRRAAPSRPLRKSGRQKNLPWDSHAVVACGLTFEAIMIHCRHFHLAVVAVRANVVSEAVREALGLVGNVSGCDFGVRGL